MFSGYESIASDSGATTLVSSTLHGVLPIDKAESSDLTQPFHQVDIGLSFKQVVSEISISEISQNKAAFYRWMKTLPFQQLNSDRRAPVMSYLFWLQGTLKLSEGEIDEALADLNQSLEAAKNLKPPVDTLVPKILNNLALAYETKKDYSLAIATFKKSIQFFELSKNPAMKEEWLLFSLSNLASLFNIKGDYAQADVYLKKTEALLNLDTISSANSYLILNLLSFYHNSGQSDSFHTLQNRSVAYFSGSEASTQEKAYFLNLTGGVCFMEGNYQKAIHYKNQALLLAQLAGNRKLSTSIKTQLVHCYFSAGDDFEAEKMATQVIGSPRDPDSELKAQMSVLLAKIYANQGKDGSALSLLKEVQENLAHIKSNSVFKIGILYNAGLAYLSLENYREAERCFTARLGLLKRYFSDNSTLIANSYLNLGISNLHLGNQQKAEDFFLKSLEVIENGNQGTLSQTDRKLTLLSHLSLAKICKSKWLMASASKQITCGMRHVTRAMEMVDQFRSEIEFDQDRITMAGRVEEILNLGVWLSAQNYLTAPNDSSYNVFFAYSQRKKNNSLMTAIKEKDDLVRANLPPPLFNAEHESKSKISTLQFYLTQENEKENPDEKKISYWQRSLVASYRELDSVKEIIRVSYPNYYELKYKSPFIDLKQAQLNIGPSEAFMDLFLNEDFLLINLITSDTVMVVQKEMGASILRAARKFTKEASTPFNGFSTREDIRHFFENGYALYEAFFEPVSSFICNKKLILVPDPVLASLPFEALITRKPDNNTLFNNAPWLIREHSVSYLYNAALLSSISDNPQFFSGLDAFAPEYKGTSAMHDSVLLGIRQGLNTKLRPIPGAMEEVDHIARLFNGQKFTGSEASLVHFEQQLSENKILHLAMHSIISGRDPMDSKLVFSPQGADSSGVLEAHAIYNYQTNSPLIALSSCNSGMGKELAGEGIMSLSRAFAFAGAKSILMTLWAVNDKAASRLVSSFYYNLKQGLTKDDALSKAKNDFLDKASPLYAHPYYWANYVISGNQYPLIQKASLLEQISARTLVISGGAFLLFLGLIYGRVIRKRRKQTKQ